LFHFNEDAESVASAAAELESKGYVLLHASRGKRGKSIFDVSSAFRRFGPVTDNVYQDVNVALCFSHFVEQKLTMGFAYLKVQLIGVWDSADRTTVSIGRLWKAIWALDRSPQLGSP
jgi:hypothetical protein